MTHALKQIEAWKIPDGFGDLNEKCLICVMVVGAMSEEAMS